MVAERHAPLIQKRVHGFQNCPWVSSKIKQDIRQRDYYLKKARKTNRDEDWLNYRASRNRVTKNIRKVKQAYNKWLVESHCSDEKDSAGGGGGGRRKEGRKEGSLLLRVVRFN